MQMNRKSDVGKLISDFVNSWHSIITSKDYGLKKCTSYLTISLPQDARAGVQMIWDLCLEIKYNSRQWTVSKSALRQKKQVNQWSGRQRHRWSTAGSSNSTNWRLPQIRLTPRRQILLSGFRQILNNWEANTLLPIDPLCPANIHLWPPHKYSQLTNIWEGLMKSRNVKPGNHGRLIRGVFGFVRLFCW